MIRIILLLLAASVCSVAWVRLAYADEWTGLYVGGSIGASRLATDRESYFERSSQFSSRDIGYSESFGGPNGPERHDFVTLRTIDELSRYQALGSAAGELGPTAGIIFGGNFRFGTFLLGAELNLDWSDLANTSNVVFSSDYLHTHRAVQSVDGGPYLPIQNDVTTNSYSGQLQIPMKMDWKATAIVRAGTLLSEHALIYGLIGYTRAGFVETPFSTSDGFTTPFDSRDGITLGVGIEANVGNGWFLRTEYRRTEFDSWSDQQSETTTYAGASYIQIMGSGSRSKIEASIDEVRGALTYRFKTLTP